MSSNFLISIPASEFSHPSTHSTKRKKRHISDEWTDPNIRAPRIGPKSDPRNTGYTLPKKRPNTKFSRETRDRAYYDMPGKPPRSRDSQICQKAQEISNRKAKNKAKIQMRKFKEFTSRELRKKRKPYENYMARNLEKHLRKPSTRTYSKKTITQTETYLAATANLKRKKSRVRSLIILLNKRTENLRQLKKERQDPLLITRKARGVTQLKRRLKRAEHQTQAAKIERQRTSKPIRRLLAKKVQKRKRNKYDLLLEEAIRKRELKERSNKQVEKRAIEDIRQNQFHPHPFKEGEFRDFNDEWKKAKGYIIRPDPNHNVRKKRVKSTDITYRKIRQNLSLARPSDQISKFIDTYITIIINALKIGQFIHILTDGYGSTGTLRNQFKKSFFITLPNGTKIKPKPVIGILLGDKAVRRVDP